MNSLKTFVVAALLTSVGISAFAQPPHHHRHHHRHLHHRHHPVHR